MKLLASLDRKLAYVETGVIVALSTAALALGVMQVVLRYVFNMGFPWTEALFVNLTIWAMLFGGSRAVRDGLHVRVDLLATLLPRHGVWVVEIVSMLASAALCAFFFYCGIVYVQFVGEMGIRDLETHIPDAITYAIVPVAMAAFILRYVILIVDWVRNPQSGAPTEPVKHGGDVA